MVGRDAEGIPGDGEGACVLNPAGAGKEGNYG
jgi:hypothetical protein